ncbi:MAG TPA: hypothetical protein VGY52_09095, partial [Roseiarcus sp.]|nr:hypothetical protein [Roseiarcus sp.]
FLTTALVGLKADLHLRSFAAVRLVPLSKLGRKLGRQVFDFLEVLLFQRLASMTRRTWFSS